jgi:hypothetical protein
VWKRQIFYEYFIFFTLQAFETVKNVILKHPSLKALPITQSSPAWSIFMSFEHEHIHMVRFVGVDLSNESYEENL